LSKDVSSMCTVRQIAIALFGVIMFSPLSYTNVRPNLLMQSVYARTSPYISSLLIH